MFSRSLAIAALFVVAATTVANAQIPSTDIFVVKVDGDEVGAVRRITDRDGYDNQPQFLLDGKSLVYTSLRGESGTNIYRYDLATGDATVVVDTPESEYSPTPVPGGDAISVVRDYGDLKQQLWSFPLGPGEPRLLLPDVNPVGYHAWIAPGKLILFVLGEPHTLQLATVGPGAGDVVAEAPGRALARIPGSAEMSFVDKSGDPWWLIAIDTKTGATRRLTATIAEREDYAWSPDGAAWMGDGSRLFRWHPDGGTWTLVADLKGDGVSDVTRLAFSPDGKMLALVGSR